MTTRSGKCVLIVVVCLCWIPPGYAESDTDRTLSPYFYIEGGDPSVDRFPLKSTQVTVNITGVIAYVVIKQEYENTGLRPLNARYVFPASTRAAVHGMKMTIGDDVITARVKEREAAQKEFNQAKEEGKSASLLKQQRPNVFSMNVANILPRDTVAIELRYTELIVPTGGVYSFVFPTLVGPRYTSLSEANAPETDRWIENPYLKAGSDPMTTFNIFVTLSTGLPLQDAVCPSHSTEIFYESESVANVLLAESETFGGNRDFILNYRLAGEQIESGLMRFEGEDEKFFLLMVQPPERVETADIPPREYIFVVDVSGSMNGFPLNTAKKLLDNLIGNLRATDTFNVILFAGSSQVMARSSLPATRKNVSRAIRFISNKRGGGGTELLSALKRGAALPGDDGFARTLLVITDGYIGAEKEVFQMIQSNLSRMNVFAFGIGSSVNRYLIEGMAKAGQGEPFVVTRPQEAPEAAARFREYVRAPVLTGISIDYEGFEPYAVEPPAVPDLFAARPLIIFGKYQGRPEGTIAVRGVGGIGTYEQQFDIAGTAALEVNSALRYLWARTRIARLSDACFGDRDSENRQEITTLGLTYNLLTDYTSFIAVKEEIRNTQGPSEEVDQPLALPLNVSNLAVGRPVASVPEPGLILILAGTFVFMAILNRRGRQGRSTDL